VLRFAKAPDAVFQAILRDGLDFTIDFVSDMLPAAAPDSDEAREDFAAVFPDAGKSFPPKLAFDTLQNLRKCLDRPEVYYLNDYHYLLLFDVLRFFVEVHNDGVLDAIDKRDKRNMSLVGPFYVEKIDFEDLIDLFFFDIDFLTSSETMLNLPPWFKDTYNSETFALTQGMLPHPEELALNVDELEDSFECKVTTARYFGKRSKVYPDYEYFEKAGAEWPD